MARAEQKAAERAAAVRAAARESEETAARRLRFTEDLGADAERAKAKASATASATEAKALEASVPRLKAAYRDALAKTVANFPGTKAAAEAKALLERAD